MGSLCLHYVDSVPADPLSWTPRCVCRDTRFFVFIVVIAVVVFICHRRGASIFRPERGGQHVAGKTVTSLEWAVLVFLAMTFSPQTTMRRMVLLLLIYTVAIGVFLAQNAKGSRTLLIIAVALTVAGLSFPQHRIEIWRIIGGPSWCAVALILTVVWAGSRAIFEMTKPICLTSQENGPVAGSTRTNHFHPGS